MMNNWQELKPSVVFNCDDAHVTCEALAAQGVQIMDQLKKRAWGTYAKFADPDGK
jgi:lactoylglutathione lyase